tara:strand:+ start:22 stop:441 length:420 start_codon:yes stop_codon:yes gene_type:complete
VERPGARRVNRHHQRSRHAGDATEWRQSPRHPTGLRRRGAGANQPGRRSVGTTPVVGPIRAPGELRPEVGGHAGISDTSQLLHVAPEHVRIDRRAPRGGFDGSGVSGDPTCASVERGRRGIELKVEAAVRQIESLIAER